MPGDPRLRASDADRERTVELLREHCAVGRLTADEFNDRLEQAFAARNRGELDALLADLPAIDLYRLPSAGIRSAARRGSGLDRTSHGALLPAHSAPWIIWAAGSAMVVALWLAVGVIAGGAAWIPWFLLVIVPWWLELERRRQQPLPAGFVSRGRESAVGRWPRSQVSLAEGTDAQPRPRPVERFSPGIGRAVLALCCRFAFVGRVQ